MGVAAVLRAAVHSEPEPIGKQEADLIVPNARVLTMDEAMPSAEAVAVKDGVIAFVGPAAEADFEVGDLLLTFDGKMIEAMHVAQAKALLVRAGEL